MEGAGEGGGGVGHKSHKLEISISLYFWNSDNNFATIWS